MISTGRTDHDRSLPYHPVAAAAAAEGDGDAEDMENGNRMDRTPRSDEGQADEQGTNHGERSLLIPDDQ